MGFIRFLIWLLVAAAIVYLAWDQPLRYRFMTADEIAQEQYGGPAPDGANRAQTSKQWQPKSTTLDRPGH